MNKKKTILMVFIMAAVLLVGRCVYAAYVSRSYQKAVVATVQKSVPFSSNYLQLMDIVENPSPDIVSPVISKENGKVTFQVTVNNFSLTNTSQTANGYITYTARFEFDGPTDGCKVVSGSADKIPSTQKYVTFKDTLKTGRSTNTYTVTVPESAMDQLKIKATVIPDETSKNLVGNKMLAAVFVLKTGSGKVEFGCTGEYVDSDSGKMPYEYSAFRYRVEITTGRGAVTLSWKPDYVEPDPVFIESVGGEKTDSGDGYQSITFTMDYEDMGICNMIFYRRKGRNETQDWQKTWTALRKADIVKVAAEEIKEN